VEEYKNVLLAAGAAIIAIAVIAVAVNIVRRRRRAQMLEAPLPLIPFSSGRSSLRTPPRPDGTLPPSRVPIDPTRATTPPSAPALRTSASPSDSSPSGAPPSPYAPDARFATPRAVDPTGSALTESAWPTDLAQGAAVDGASVRYWRPADGTLQFLPGRLEVVAGRDAGQEIRFVRTPGPDGTQVSFGRAEGAPYRHVQLREPTVSRAHARMVLEPSVPSAGPGPAGEAAAPGSGSNGAGPLRWRLENLSATNPVVVNGRPLAADGGPACSVSLGEGDRIEMGEVVFRFHER
jgi:hypothetical protein